MRKRLTDQQKQQILEWYGSGEKTHAIAEATGCSIGSVYSVLEKSGLHTPGKAVRRTESASRLCGKCGKNSPSEANYCMYCGSRIKSESEMIVERALEQLTAALPYVPASQKDGLQSAVLNLAELVKSTVRESRN